MALIRGHVASSCDAAGTRCTGAFPAASCCLCSRAALTRNLAQELDISGNKIADEGLVALSELLESQLISLETLNIAGNALEVSAAQWPPSE